MPDDLDAIGGLLAFSQAKQNYYAAGTYAHLDDEHDRAQAETLVVHGRPLSVSVGPPVPPRGLLEVVLVLGRLPLLHARIPVSAVPLA
ncbi:hypothetical protein E1091_01190 [Micromonospora fluostatini]|uniref:Uncharacterized protein n=1 Tax=Micromonospora fluostatini TaxID=1629071 RepID=A0ABY2DLP5_9ACTN|nr:hypothetical protein E1091_01190 [Micromonospora fluostatini]